MSYRVDRQDGQPVLLEVWVEAAGMVPQLERVAHPYGIPVFSSGGFDSLTVKHEAAQRMLGRDKPTLVLHVGDLDPSGVSIFDAAAEDVEAFVAHLAIIEQREDVHLPQFRRAVVTREQVKWYGLPEAPPKRTDKRGNWRGGTVQAEALAPPDLAAQVEAAIRSQFDLGAYSEGLERETIEREDLLARLGAMLASKPEARG